MLRVVIYQPKAFTTSKTNTYVSFLYALGWYICSHCHHYQYMTYGTIFFIFPQPIKTIVPLVRKRCLIFVLTVLNCLQFEIVCVFEEWENIWSSFCKMWTKKICSFIAFSFRKLYLSTFGDCLVSLNRFNLLVYNAILTGTPKNVWHTETRSDFSLFACLLLFTLHSCLS